MDFGRQHNCGFIHLSGFGPRDIRTYLRSIQKYGESSEDP
jgi:hypothetical protein